MRLTKDLGRWAELDEGAMRHHADTMRQPFHHREVVRDQQDGEVERSLEVPQQPQDLELERDIQRRGRLIRDEEGGPSGQGHREADALLHAAGELMGVGPSRSETEAIPTRSSHSTAA